MEGGRHIMGPQRGDHFVGFYLLEAVIASCRLGSRRVGDGIVCVSEIILVVCTMLRNVTSVSDDAEQYYRQGSSAPRRTNEHRFTSASPFTYPES